MKKKNYLSGLLAGVLTAGMLQGSDGKEKMPGLEEKSMSVKQTETNSAITEELKMAASELAASYDDRAIESKNDDISRIFRARSQYLGTTFEVENAKELPETDHDNYRFFCI